jgi:Glycoside hydrolase 123 N-terminal domain/Immunoglobulin I-set domain/Glycoside hydrolase 123, catalytic domain
VAISGATSSSYTTPATVSSDNGAQFTVLVSNSAGNVTSSAATLTVNAAPVAPSITTQPVSQTVTAGQTATFTVAATGTAPFSYQWQKSGANIVGATSASYTTPATMTTDNGAQFAVVVSNSAGNVTSNAATLTVNAAVPPMFTVWVAPSLDRVGTTDTPGTASSISLSGARGETVDAQVIVQGPLSGLTNVNLGASALTGPGGATIPASSVTLYREYYITVTGTGSYGGGSNPPLGSGTYAEPLIPFNDPETGSPLCTTTATLKACNATLSAGQNQPYWIDISVPRGATNSPTGTYTGTISVTADQGTTTVPVTLTVWNFELPAQPSELSEWTLWNPAAGNTTTTLDQALMRNKVMGRYDVAANASSDMTNFGLNRSGLDGYYFIGIQCNGSYSSLPSTSQINAAAVNFPAALPLDFYVADELNGCSGAYSTLKTMGTNAHAANPIVKTIMTTNAPDSNLFNEGDGRSAIDHWVLLDAMQQWPSLPYTGAGDLWSYASCNTGFGNTPAWMVDYPPINERIQAGFLNWTQGATGLLYWRADGWTAGNAIGSWNNVDTTGCGGGMGRPGDGIFIYPPGPIASTESAPGIRLKAIRDGIQDYEYAQILKNIGQVPFVNSVLQPIATSWTNWSQVPNALEAARLQLGQLLHQLAP